MTDTTTLPPPAPPTTLSKLLEKIELAFSLHASPSTPVAELQRRSKVYLPIVIQTHFKVSDQVAEDLITSSRTLGELAARIDELHTPNLFQPAAAPPLAAPAAAV